MVTVNDAVIARLKKDGQTFEVLVDCEAAMDFAHGKDIPVAQIVAEAIVCTDSKKGLQASDAALQSAFGSTDFDTVATTIIKKGEIQLTTEYRDEIRKKKFAQLVHAIHRNAVDPKMHTPHPVQRIENALAEAKFHIDEHKPVEAQIPVAVKKLQPILPIKFEVKEIRVTIGPEHAAKAYPVLKKFGSILSETWANDGKYIGVIEMPGGMEEEFHTQINGATHGNVETEIIKTT